MNVYVSRFLSARVLLFFIPDVCLWKFLGCLRLFFSLAINAYSQSEMISSPSQKSTVKWGKNAAVIYSGAKLRKSIKKREVILISEESFVFQANLSMFGVAIANICQLTCLCQPQNTIPAFFFAKIQFAILAISSMAKSICAILRWPR